MSVQRIVQRVGARVVPEAVEPRRAAHALIGCAPMRGYA
ncbi:hypothetical protein F504_765 [Ralstonia pseudosolanacearum FQY_4]|nr:hypothetical protein F504_765 [Ralstonia pseudosolanacearum FQY_4]